MGRRAVRDIVQSMDVWGQYVRRTMLPSRTYLQEIRPLQSAVQTSLARNLKRVAETWMDEYTEFIYQRRPEYRHLSTGDLTARRS
ncbi:polypeptide N-acetylgalactosaminyltransferase 10-like [Salvelinus sp. IW2-2015]|uniref:polypeptide N-acetylgalactosaminyltransferase 10-like n=1 Tax=Salvelinus sp. IW2-2015 TaxID=2691554 RepID=UPI000CEB0E1D|nr:polypeptide N-acetylgalactosaminyltransferase 10-like [Salvelinus alpinus]